uniref:Beta-microseminoprotein-like n=1 Tax=Scleropages formosus TaxID=113540 RepID=A0A8C9RF50_SCLFO
MKFLPLALLLCVSLPHCWAACHFFDSFKVLNHCQDFVDKSWHPIDSNWRNSVCQDCTCSSCCDAYSTPVVFPDDCMKEFDHINCKYNVFKKDDRNQECPVFDGEEL